MQGREGEEAHLLTRFVLELFVVPLSLNVICY
jgi:hypothetical protein